MAVSKPGKMKRAIEVERQVMIALAQWRNNPQAWRRQRRNREEAGTLDMGL